MKNIGIRGWAKSIRRAFYSAKPAPFYFGIPTPLARVSAIPTDYDYEHDYDYDYDYVYDYDYEYLWLDCYP